MSQRTFVQGLTGIGWVPRVEEGVTIYDTINQELIDATADGSTLNIAEIATIEECTVDSKLINFVFQPGAFNVTVNGTMTFENCTYNIISGNAAGFVWAGTTGVPMFQFSRCQYLSFRDMRVASNPSAPLQAAFWTKSRNTGQVSHGLMFDNISVDGTDTGGLNYGWQIGVYGVSNGNNDDEHIFNRCRAQNYDVAGWAIQQPQSKAHRFYDCVVTPTAVGQYGVTTLAGHGGDGSGSFYWMGGGGGGHTIADFGLGSPDDLILISDFQLESSNRLLVAQSGGSSPWPITIRNGRWSGDRLNADGKAIIYTNRGPLLVENCTFENPLGIALQLNLAADGRCVATAVGNNIASTLANPYTTDNNANGRWTIVSGNVGDNAPVPLPAVVPVLLFSEVSTITSRGSMSVITDSTTTTPGATITGGGGSTVFGWYNGTNWVVMGF